MAGNGNECWKYDSQQKGNMYECDCIWMCFSNMTPGNNVVDWTLTEYQIETDA